MIETILLGYILAITYLANLARVKIHRVGRSRLTYLGYAFTLIGLAAAPLIWIRSANTEQSPAAVTLVGIAMFWFAILISRVFVNSRPE